MQLSGLTPLNALGSFPLRRLLGVNFFTGSLNAAVDRVVGKQTPHSESWQENGHTTGGLVVAPSAPGLAVDLVKSASYREALTTANLVLTDSGFMVLLWRAFTGEKLPRHSGLKFLRAVLARPELKEPGAVFWVMPSADEDERNRAWLVSHGFPVTADDVYVAPHYPTGSIEDEALLRRIEERKPRVVMLAIGGGVQERVGLMLRDRLSDTPAILCLGAAIAFLTGGQAHIPPWADKLVLGWLLRLVSNPGKFWRRYWEALALAPLLWRHREELPVLEGSEVVKAVVSV